jgi:hypothetical protein
MGMVIFSPANAKLGEVKPANRNTLENIIKPLLRRYLSHNPDIEGLIKYAIG